MDILFPVLAIVFGFIIGSISFAVLITKAKGVDIFSVGSGNPGATNVTRALGKGWGYTCFFLDAFKGVASVLLAFGLASKLDDPIAMKGLMGIFGLFGAVLGHSFSPFLKFKGGKGVATTVGGLFTLMPLVMLIGAIVWMIVFFSTRIVAVGSIFLGISLPVSSWLLNKPNTEFWFCFLIALIILVRHRSNLQKLLESRNLKKDNL